MRRMRPALSLVMAMAVALAVAAPIDAAPNRTEARSARHLAGMDDPELKVKAYRPSDPAFIRAHGTINHGDAVTVELHRWSAGQWVLEERRDARGVGPLIFSVRLGAGSSEEACQVVAIYEGARWTRPDRDEFGPFACDGGDLRRFSDTRIVGLRLTASDHDCKDCKVFVEAWRDPALYGERVRAAFERLRRGQWEAYLSKRTQKTTTTGWGGRISFRWELYRMSDAICRVRVFIPPTEKYDGDTAFSSNMPCPVPRTR